jgi:formylglycine-generating enzyme required for sulfatase activity
MVFVPGGTFAMGSDRQHPEERFTHAVRLDGFWIDRHEVTNAQFQKFVAATGYVTLAERGPDPNAHAGLSDDVSGPGSVVFASPAKLGRDMSRWWRYQKGANWREPEGPGSTIAGRESYPVVHVAYEDAAAYARWLGGELPTEAQWEFAARGGRTGEQDWMSAFDADGKPIANTWQGVFPVYNTAEDGYAGVAPAGCFPPNGYGLYDMIGNVWEWTSDWYRPGHSRDAADNPAGPGLPDLHLAAGALPSRVIKGGSYLCSSNYCARYRPTARQPQEVDLSAGHLGFRTVLNADKDARPVRDARAVAP